MMGAKKKQVMGMMGGGKKKNVMKKGGKKKNVVKKAKKTNKKVVKKAMKKAKKVAKKAIKKAIKDNPMSDISAFFTRLLFDDEWQRTIPVMGVSGLVKTFTRAYAAGARLYEILDAEPQVKDNRLANPLGDVRGAVTFENVSFSYGDGPVLQNIDLTLDPGKTVAILGSTGSGKSSLVHLVPRFYDPTEGRVLIDGQDLREVRLSSVRENIGIVLQDVFVFSGTISENISYGHPSASFEDIEHAAKIAHLHDDIMESHLDYDTIVGERGVTLSGGQRQRLAIARTVLMDPPILILDDSTSSVDTMTEEKIQQALADLMKNRTTFVIAHRLSTIRDADSVIVLDQGRIVEHGTHDDLSTQNGHYRRIYDLQFGGHLVEEASMLVGAGGSHK